MVSRTGLLTVMGAALLVVGVTLVQGMLTERWGEKHSELLDVFARRLERLFPDSCGDWSFERTLDISRAELDRAGAVGSVSRAYRNRKSNAVLSTFVVCAKPHDASGHTPDRCYPGAGFEIAEPEHRETITLRDGRSAEAYTGTFAKEGQTLRVFWTYGVPTEPRAEGTPPDGEPDDPAAAPGESLTWVAPQLARISLKKYPAVYKLYAIIDQTKIASTRATAECTDFIAELLPAFESAIAADAAGSTPGDAATPEAKATPDGSAG